MNKTQEQAFKSIERQWNGGEHRLAGARASELVFGASTTMNEALFDELRDRLSGIERYISAPVSGTIIEKVSDQGGDPMARQPDNRKEATDEPNQSGDVGKDQQDAVDKTLEPGRKARAKAAGKAKGTDEGKSGAGSLVSTKLNPDPQTPEAA
jgi:hypothetical protein